MTRTRRARWRMMSSSDQDRLDRLAQADVVGDQEVNPRHLDCPDHRVELIVLNVDPRSEGRLDTSDICRG